MLVKSKVKYIQSLSQKQLRDQLNVFVAEGPKIFKELASAANAEPVEIYATKEWVQRNAGWNNIIEEVTSDELSRISSLKSPNQVLAVFKRPHFTDTLTLKNNISLLLDGIQDPGNMGTIIRCADWFGVKNIICSRDCADVYSAKVVQATMGSICRVRIEYVDLISFLKNYPEIPVYAATLTGKELNKFISIKEGFLLIGNESKGIDSLLLSFANHTIRIPGKGGAESLNAGVATGILLAFMNLGNEA